MWTIPECLIISLINLSNVSQSKVKELKEAATMLNPVSQPVRELCAARLLTISESMSKASRPKPSTAAKQPVAAAESEPEQQKPSKRARKGDAAQANSAAPAAAVVAAAAEPTAQIDYLALVFTFIQVAQDTTGCQLAVELPEGAEAALSVLKESEASISDLLAGGLPCTCTHVI